MTCASTHNVNNDFYIHNICVLTVLKSIIIAIFTHISFIGASPNDNDNVIGSGTSERGPWNVSRQQGTDTFKAQMAPFYNPLTPKT